MIVRPVLPHSSVTSTWTVENRRGHFRRPEKFSVLLITWAKAFCGNSAISLLGAAETWVTDPMRRPLEERRRKAVSSEAFFTQSTSFYQSLLLYRRTFGRRSLRDSFNFIPIFRFLVSEATKAGRLLNWPRLPFVPSYSLVVLSDSIRIFFGRFCLPWKDDIIVRQSQAT